MNFREVSKQLRPVAPHIVRFVATFLVCLLVFTAAAHFLIPALDPVYGTLDPELEAESVRIAWIVGPIIYVGSFLVAILETIRLARRRPKI